MIIKVFKIIIIILNARLIVHFIFRMHVHANIIVYGIIFLGKLYSNLCLLLETLIFEELRFCTP